MNAPAKPRPLSDKMKRVLLGMLELQEGGERSATPNNIGRQCGYDRGMAKPGRLARSSGEAIHVTTALTALRKRGLIAFGRRPDGLSGTAYGLTQLGEEEARKARAAGLDSNARRASGRVDHGRVR